MRCAALSAAIVTTALLLHRASAAQSGDKPSRAAPGDGEAVALSYQDSAASGCPTEADFRAEVAKLTSKARFTSERGARPIQIELERHGSGVVGRLVTGEDKARASREVRGKDCREVSSALAIAVALTIDPDALGAGSPEPEEQPPAPPAPPPPAPVVKPPPPAPPPKPSEPAQRKSGLLWGLGVGLGFESAWAPQLRAGVHALVLFGVGDHFRATVGGTYFPTREVDGVTFGAWFGQGNLSWNLELLGILRPYLAVGYEAGAVSSSGSGLATTVEAQRPWQTLSAGLGIRLETDEIFLQLGGSLLFPLSRQRYLISDPSGSLNPFYEVPMVGVRQETTLGVFL